MRKYCVKQTEFLRDTRKSGVHLYKHDRNDYDFGKKWSKIKRKPIFINKQADESNLRITVL